MAVFMSFKHLVVVSCRSVEDQLWKTVQDVVELCVVWIWEKGNVEVHTVTEFFLSVRKLQKQPREQKTNSSHSHLEWRSSRTRQVHSVMA